MEGKVYNRADVNVVGGGYRFDAFISCKITPGGAKKSYDTNNAAGEVTITTLAVPASTLEVVLKQTSEDNAKMTALNKLDGLMTFSVTDKAGNESVLTNATFLEDPEVSWEEEAGEITWVITGVLITHDINGNPISA